MYIYLAVSTMSGLSELKLLGYSVKGCENSIPYHVYLCRWAAGSCSLSLSLSLFLFFPSPRSIFRAYILIGEFVGE